jgi:hypothetical protein
MDRVGEGAEKVVEVIGNVTEKVIDTGIGLAFDNPVVIGLAVLAGVYIYSTVTSDKDNSSSDEIEVNSNNNEELIDGYNM